MVLVKRILKLGLLVSALTSLIARFKVNFLVFICRLKVASYLPYDEIGDLICTFIKLHKIHKK